MKSIRPAFLVLLSSLLVLSACGDAPADTSNSNEQDVAAQAPLVGAPSQQPLPDRPEERPNILIFLIDTQRADHLGAYGYDKPTSPNLDAFAEQGVLFERAYSQAPSTSPAHGTLFTSTHPRTHGVWNRVLNPTTGAAIYPALSDSAITMAEVFRDSGYDTAAIADGGNVHRNRGFAQGFNLWDSKFYGAYNRVDRALRWLDEERNQDAPFFLFLHTYQVHTPYIPEPRFLEMFADPNYDGELRTAWANARKYFEEHRETSKSIIRDVQQKFYKPVLPDEKGPPPSAEVLGFMKALYAAEIRQMDDAFGKLLAALDERGLSDNTILLVTSDHGEEFWEHGKFGHHQMYDTTAHIPYIVRGPSVAVGERRTDPVQLLDVMPTLLHYAAADFVPPSMQGQIIDFGKAPNTLVDRPIIAEANWPEHQISWRVGDQQAMLFPEGKRAAEAYQISQDPGQSQDLASDWQDWLTAVDASSKSWMAEADAWQKEHSMQPGVRDSKKMSAAEKAELEALGYLVD